MAGQNRPETTGPSVRAANVVLLEQLESNIRNLDGLCARSLVQPMKPSDPDHALAGALASDDFFLKRPTGLGEAVDLIALDARELMRSICLCPYNENTAAYRRDVEDLRNCLAEMMRVAGADRPVETVNTYSNCSRYAVPG
jgi:hypothetical protein